AHDLAAARPGDVQRLRRGLDALRATERVPAAAGASDPETAENLRALGYVAAAGPAAAGGPRLDPQDALATRRRFAEAIWADARGEHAAAAQSLSALVREQPANVAMRQALAAALRGAGRAGEAARVLADLETLAPSDALAWHERSIALDAAGETAEALRAERRAAPPGPALPQLQNQLRPPPPPPRPLPPALDPFTRATPLAPGHARGRAPPAD